MKNGGKILHLVTFSFVLAIVIGIGVAIACDFVFGWILGMSHELYSTWAAVLSVLASCFVLVLTALIEG